jgi:hypothetical protein
LLHGVDDHGRRPSETTPTSSGAPEPTTTSTVVSIVDRAVLADISATSVPLT